MYKPGDYIGTAGLEKFYEEEIRGTNGVEFVLKDNLGREVGPFEYGKLDRKANSGLDAILGIDLELQQFGDTLMKNKVGVSLLSNPPQVKSYAKLLHRRIIQIYFPFKTTEV